MNYADPFGIQLSTPLSRTLRRIELQKDTTLNWPEGYEGPNYIASINLINPAAASFQLSMPDARAANLGTGMLFVNVGEYRTVLRDHAGTQLTDFDPGEAKYIFCTNNRSEAGEWRITGFGETTSGADAVTLAGAGLAPIGGKLAAAYPVSITSSNIDVTEAGRGKIFVAPSGSVRVNLPQHTIGNSFFIGAVNGGSGTMTIAPQSGTINGFATLELAPNESAFVFCSGTSSWYSIGYGRSTEFQFTKLVKDISAGGEIVLTSAEASNKLMQFIGTPDEDVEVIIPSVVGIYYIQNAYVSPNSLTFKTVSGSGIAMNSSDRAILYCDGVNVVAAQSAAVGTNISIVDGTLSSPSINFAADTNTGIYRADVDTIGLVSNGAEAARFGTAASSITGKFGIGVANPDAKLHVVAGQGEVVRIQGTGSITSFWNTANTAKLASVFATTNELRDTVEGADAVRSFYIDGIKKFAVNKDGVEIFGGGIKLPGNATLATTGSNTFTGMQQMTAERFKFVPLGLLAAGSRNIDLALAGSYSCSFSGVVNFTFSNKPPAGYDQTVYLKVTNGAAFQPNWPAGTRYPKGVKPVLTPGVDLLAIWYDPEFQCHVVGPVWQDYK